MKFSLLKSSCHGWEVKARFLRIITCRWASATLALAHCWPHFFSLLFFVCLVGCCACWKNMQVKCAPVSQHVAVVNSWIKIVEGDSKLCRSLTHKALRCECFSDHPHSWFKTEGLSTTSGNVTDALEPFDSPPLWKLPRCTEPLCWWCSVTKSCPATLCGQQRPRILCPSTVSRSLLQLVSIESVMPSHPLSPSSSFCLSIFLRIKVISNESALQATGFQGSALPVPCRYASSKSCCLGSCCDCINAQLSWPSFLSTWSCWSWEHCLITSTHFVISLLRDPTCGMRPTTYFWVLSSKVKRALNLGFVLRP